LIIEIMLLCNTALVGLPLDKVLLALPIRAWVTSEAAFLFILSDFVFGLGVDFSVVIATALSALISHVIVFFEKLFIFKLLD